MTVIHVPHASTHIPEDIRGDILLEDRALEAELLHMTDRYTDEMALSMADAVARQTVEVVRAPVSRLVCDVERFRDDAAEPMSGVGMGAVYERTSEGTPLRRPADSRHVGREAVLQRYYDPHHARLDAMAAAAVERDGRCLVIDLHSFPALPLPYERDPSLARPEICIGTDDFHTPKHLAQAVERFFVDNGFETGRNEPFAGSLVPDRYYHSDPRVASIMIEIRRDLYMDEGTGERTAGLRTLERLLSELIRRLELESV